MTVQLPSGYEEGGTVERLSTRTEGLAALTETLRGLRTAVDAPAGYVPQTSFRAQPQIGVAAFRDLILSAYPGTRSFGITRAADVPGVSEHKEGRAWDWGLDGEGQGELAVELLGWLLGPDADGEPFAPARRFGIMYLIWNRRIWGAYQADEGWRPYRGRNPHTDHVHFSFSWPGALARTSWWTANSPLRVGSPLL